jgi:hypothetical protein
MSRTPILVLFCLLFAGSQLGAQSEASPQELTFQVSAAPTWLDTGLDLQPGDVVKIAASAAPSSEHSSGGVAACDPAGITSPNAGERPLASAPAGALIARLHGETSVPVLVGAGSELRIEETSHLLLGMNSTGTSVCQGGFAVKLQKTSAASAAAGSGNVQKTRGQQLKSQLGNAAQIFMSGQFGMGKSESTGSNAVSSSGSSGTEPAPTVSLKISEDALDADLRKKLTSLPRRVNDQFQNQGDMVNFVLIGSLKEVQGALDAATWHIADTDNRRAMMNAVLQTYDSKDYLAMPMSTLYLFGRKQDFGYEMAEPIAMVASRHHFRIWKAPFTWNGHDVWVGAGTHDIGFAKDKRNNSVTHKIDPAVDGERDNIGSSLQKAQKAKSLSYFLPPDAVQEAKNATGDGYHSDGRLLVVFVQ